MPLSKSGRLSSRDGSGPCPRPVGSAASISRPAEHECGMPVAVVFEQLSELSRTIGRHHRNSIYALFSCT